jgi:hypothetical protein
MTRTLYSHARVRFVWLFITPVLLAWLGCTDVTEPVAPASAPVAAAVAPVLTPVVAGAIEDALDRVLPAMSDGAGSKGLEMALAALLEALARGESAATMASVESAERALDGFTRGATTSAGDAVHVDVIELALASVRARVEGR